MKDKVAIVGAGSTVFRRDMGRSSASLACEAAMAAIRDAGLHASDIDGIAATGDPGAPSAERVAAILGIDNVSHFAKSSAMGLFSVIDAVNAIYAGACSTALVYHPVTKAGWNSRSAARDPFRKHLLPNVVSIPESINAAVAYAAWASRYIHEYGVKREHFGLVALNSRSNAMHNPRAAMREPMTMEDYLAARMIREPFCLFDMDLPVDGAVAFVLTATERARDLSAHPVLIHATAAGLVAENEEDQLSGLDHHGQHVVVEQLKAKSDVWLDEVDVFYPYDGFTVMTLAWIENVGWCAPGQAGDFREASWDSKHNRLLLGGRVPVNTNGGSLSEGATRGSGPLYDAVQQLRGAAGELQVPGARVALVTPGGFFFNAQGAVLTTDAT